MHRVARAGLSALAAAVLASATASTAAADPPPIPTQGMYEWCNPAQSADGCASRLQRIGQAGFRVVLNGWLFPYNPSEATLRTYAQNAAAAGVHVMWPLGGTGFESADPSGTNLLSTYSRLASNCHCSDNQGLLAYLVGILRSLPNTYGYYLADEPQQAAHDQLAGFVSRIKALDAGHPRVIVGCGICAGGPDANVAWMADLDIMLGSDAYPVIGGAPNPAASYSYVQQNVASLDRAARAYGRQEVVVLQSWRWGDSASDSQSIGVDPASTRYPTRDEIEAQRDAAIENGHPDLILWFTLTQVIGWEPGQSSSNWWNPTDTQQRWANLIGGAFAPPPTHPATAAATSAAPATPTAPAVNHTPVARLAIRRGSHSRSVARFTADGRSSRDPDGRIVRYVWTLNGRRLAGDRAGRRAFRVRRGRVQRITLTVIDNRGARAAVRRRFVFVGAGARLTTLR
jgi:YD repeat-containing protein